MLRLAALAAVALTAHAAIDADLVTSLPGWTGALPSKWYSGYLNGINGAHLHYILIESTNAPATDPVTVWFNGGPGCSSLEGLFAEHGQLQVAGITPNNPGPAGTLTRNPQAWSNVSNVLYIEQPACVGFSYADTPLLQCSWNDTSSAESNYAALQAFYAGFPELLANDLFIAGESYAGIYVPQTAYQIVTRNAAGQTPKLNLQGILVGNGCLGNSVGECSGSWASEIEIDIPYLCGHSLCDPAAYAQFQAQCTDSSNPSLDCQATILAIHASLARINVYDIYQPCTDNGASSAEAGQARRLLQHMASRDPNGPIAKRLSLLTGPDECGLGPSPLSAYLNTPAVQTALNVKKPEFAWSVCTNDPRFNYDSTEADERVTTYPTILAAGVRVLIFDGDADACVPFNDNAAWTASMGYPVSSGWRSWMYADNQVAGYTINYAPAIGGNFTFASVKGAGHMVPEYAPEAAFALFSRFIAGSAL